MSVPAKGGGKVAERRTPASSKLALGGSHKSAQGEHYWLFIYEIKLTSDIKKALLKAAYSCVEGTRLPQASAVEKTGF